MHKIITAEEARNTPPDIQYDILDIAIEQFNLAVGRAVKYGNSSITLEGLSNWGPMNKATRKVFKGIITEAGFVIKFEGFSSCYMVSW